MEGLKEFYEARDILIQINFKENRDIYDALRIAENSKHPECKKICEIFQTYRDFKTKDQFKAIPDLYRSLYKNDHVFHLKKYLNDQTHIGNLVISAMLGGVGAMIILGEKDEVWKLKSIANSYGKIDIPEDIKSVVYERAFIWGREFQNLDLKYYCGAMHPHILRVQKYYKDCRIACKDAIYEFNLIFKKYFDHLVNKDVRRKISEMLLLNDIEWSK